MPLHIEAPPFELSKNLEEVFTCTLNEFSPDKLLIFSLEVGAAVPIPTFPRVSIHILSRFCVKNNRGIVLVVPNLDERVALLLPVRFHWAKAG